MPEITSTTDAETSNDRYVTRLSLNAAALERLLGDEKGELRIDLAQAVVENLFKKHIKTIMSEPAIHSRMEAIQRDFNERVEKMVQSSIGQWVGNGWEQKKLVANSSLTNIVNEAARKAFDELLSASITDVVTSYAETIESRIDQKINKTLDSLISVGVDVRLRKLATLAKEADLSGK
mgnify:CR=1 FL=1